ncbi:hypothetical protein [Ornithinibacillus sp. 179-J 7C1 HS]|uniref:hypothetical protein n=1 Tax=Ornithinibacillus sp. 179-J 7C1 HS TaxID=3142384 RepID=UPI00399FEBA5
MEKPNYVLKANEGVIVPKNENFRMIKKAVWIVVIVIVIGSIIFQDDLFGELSWSGRIMLVVLALGLSFAGGNKRVPSPFEIQFYDDYLIVYREKKYYNKNLIRKEYDKFFYKDITKCQYRAQTKQINIYGVIEGIRYKYRKDGTLPEKPNYHRTTNGGISWFYTTESPEIDFVTEIEKHSPVKVVVEDN